MASKIENNKITSINSSNHTLQNKQLNSSSPSIPQLPSIPQKIKAEETNSPRRASTTTKENESIKMELLNNLKKNQSILDIKMDAAKLHHQHIMLNMLRNTPITAKNFYKVTKSFRGVFRGKLRPLT